MNISERLKKIADQANEKKRIKEAEELKKQKELEAKWVSVRASIYGQINQWLATTLVSDAEKAAEAGEYEVVINLENMVNLRYEYISKNKYPDFREKMASWSPDLEVVWKHFNKFLVREHIVFVREGMEVKITW